MQFVGPGEAPGSRQTGPSAPVSGPAAGSRGGDLLDIELQEGHNIRADTARRGREPGTDREIAGTKPQFGASCVLF